MVSVKDLPLLEEKEITGYRLVNSKFPPISIFDDVADQAEFEVLFHLQSLTNPRLRNEVGRLELICKDEIPFGIAGCSYATAPFTHVNPQGSRFSDGSFGMLYIAQDDTTAIAEVKYHQQTYWSNVPDLHYERFVFRSLQCQFNTKNFVNAQSLSRDHDIYHETDYSASRAFGKSLKQGKYTGLQYHSVRSPEATCWGLITPKPVSQIVQTAHYEMIWNGQVISHINKITQQL